MAEIRVERRQRSSLLPWMLGLALLVLLIWALSSMLNNDGSGAGEVEGNAAPAETISLPEPRFRQIALLTQEEPWLIRAA